MMKLPRFSRWAAMIVVAAWFPCGIPASAEDRIWTDEQTGRTIDGTLVERNADGSEVRLKRKSDGKVVPVKTERLVETDREFIKAWKPAAAAAVPAAGGIVTRESRVLDQAQGGKSRVLDDIVNVLSKYGEAMNDTTAHPQVVIYAGPAMSPDLKREARVTYLMPRAKAEEQLMSRTGIVSKKPAVAPGFPPGMILYTYDIRFRIYNRLYLMVDQADQVVCLQFKAENASAPARPPEWVPPDLPCSTFDYMNTETRGKGYHIDTHVLDMRVAGGFVVVNMAVLKIRETTTWHVPEPLIRQILHHVAQRRGD